MILTIRDCVVLDFHGRHVADQLFVLKLVQTETIPTFHLVVVVLDVGNHTFSHLQLYILGRCILLLVLIHGFEILPDDGPLGDDVCSKQECHDRDEGCRYHVRTHQPLETDTCGKHGDNFGIACQL